MSKVSSKAWPIVKLSDVCTTKSGGTPSRDVSKYYGGAIPWVKSGELKDKFISSTEEYLTEEGITNSSAKLFPPGTLLIALYGATVGKLGILQIAAATNQAVCGIFVSSEVDRDYLFYFLLKERQKLVNLSFGGAQPNISQELLRSINLPLPPLPEQQRIAAILDKADAIRRKRQEAIRLTDELLRSVFLDMFGNIPARKSKHPFGTIRSYVVANSGKSSKEVLSKETTSIPIYGGNGRNGWATKALYDEPVVVVGRVGQQCGITHLTSGPCWVTDNAIVVRVTDKTKLHPIYLSVALQNSPLRTTVERFDLPFINQSIILDYEIPLPPIDLQLEYAKIQEQVRKSRNQLTSSSHSSDDLFNSLVQRAFRGEL